MHLRQRIIEQNRAAAASVLHEDFPHKRLEGAEFVTVAVVPLRAPVAQGNPRHRIIGL